MKPSRTIMLLFVAVVMVSIASAQTIPGRYIVQLKAVATPAGVAKAHGVAPDFVYKSAVKGFAGFIAPGQLRALKQDANVVSIVPDRVVKAIAAGGNGKPPKGGGATPQPQVIPAGVTRIGAAPEQSLFTGQGVGVAVVDTGLDFNHADLPTAGAAHSFFAYSTSAQDDEGHGTHVGGIIAAKNNDIDTVGVAPGATLYAVKVLNQLGSGSDSAVIAGLDWVHTNAVTVSPAIRVVNMSLGREGSIDDNPALRTAIQNLYASGIVVVVAAGNSSSLEVSDQVPCVYPEVLAVGSTTALQGSSKYRSYTSGIAADTASYFTSDGAFSTSTNIGVTISAPGEDKEDITRNAMIQSVGILSTKLGGGTTRMSGTSMAAPHVCGVVARFFEAAPAVTSVETVRDMIRSHASGVGTAPIDSPTTSYSFDGEREGVVTVPEQWDL